MSCENEETDCQSSGLKPDDLTSCIKNGAAARSDRIVGGDFEPGGSSLHHIPAGGTFGEGKKSTSRVTEAVDGFTEIGGFTNWEVGEVFAIDTDKGDIGLFIGSEDFGDGVDFFVDGHCGES